MLCNFCDVQYRGPKRIPKSSFFVILGIILRLPLRALARRDRAGRAPRLILKIVGARLATAPARLSARFENQGGLYDVITKSYLWVGWFWKL